eukprot:11326225-Alexandrium_andersonii.AAC.1
MEVESEEDHHVEKSNTDRLERPLGQTKGDSHCPAGQGCGHSLDLKPNVPLQTLESGNSD